MSTDSADIDPRDITKDLVAVSGERTTMIVFLRYQRDTLEMKCAAPTHRRRDRSVATG